MTKLSMCGSRQRGELELAKSGEGEKGNSFFQNVKNYLWEFASNGTIHGLRYLGEKRTLIEKIWWTISMVVSLCFCIHCVRQTYGKWQTMEKLGYMSFLCENDVPNLQKLPKFVDSEILDFYHDVQPDFYSSISDCRFMGEKYDCSHLFYPVITDEGMCYAFNLIDRSELLTELVVPYKNYLTAPVTGDWNLEDGYSSAATIDAYPRRALFPGAPNGLQAKLTIDSDELDYVCRPIPGFKVSISHPQRMPRVRLQHFVLPVDRATKTAVVPDMMSTSKSVARYRPQKRNCIFPSERALKYYKVYSQNNCQLECKTNYTRQQCGCVGFFMPREQSTPICGPGSARCMQYVAKRLRRGLIKQKIDKLNGKIFDEPIKDCQCLPICTSMYYTEQTSQAAWDWRNFHTHMNDNTKSRHMSLLQVYFKNDQFITSERNELYGETDFYANVGGLLGLFVGFSALSLVEIVYYFTLRIICNIMIFGRRNWSGGKIK